MRLAAAARRFLAVTMSALLTAGPASAEDDVFEFFEQEAKVVTASFLPLASAHAPATVRVVTSADIKASGARTIWDALRGLPGVDVTQTSAFQGEVGIRGQGGPLNNRVLVLLDGRTVMNANFDFILWEEIPVTMEEISRIEVVEGPASALYGANAIGGVINIITKAPAQIDGGRTAFSAGEAGFLSGSALYGTRKGKLDYKISAGARSGNGFADETTPAIRTNKVHALAGWDLTPDSRLSLSGGFTDERFRASAGVLGTPLVDGYSGFLRSDYHLGEMDLIAFWNRTRATAKEFPALSDPPIDYDTLDVSLRRTWLLPWNDTIVIGGNYRRNSVHSRILENGGAEQDLGSLFFDNEWTPVGDWTLVAGGRLDRHPGAPDAFSPRGSVIYTPSDSHILRLSAGTSFRYPTLLESSARFTQIATNQPGGDLPNPPFTDISVLIRGSRGLLPERMFQAELAHTGRFGSVRTTLTGFYYEIKHLILGTEPVLDAAVPPTAGMSSTFGNLGGSRALGFEAGTETELRGGLSLFANYSYISLRDDDPSVQTGARNAPRHKVNAGARLSRGGVTAGLWAHWVDKTFWNASPTGSPLSYGKVPDYLLLNGRVGYEFSGRAEGWEVAVGAFNLAARNHYEMLPAVGSQPGMNSEIIRSRWIGTVSYRFH